MKKFRITVPIYKTATGKISFSVWAENIKRAYDIFVTAAENGEFHLHDWGFEIYNQIDNQIYEKIHEGIYDDYDEVHDVFIDEIYDQFIKEIYDYIFIEEIKNEE